MEPPDNTVAIAALIVSICSAAVILGGLIWQFTLYRLQGSRLKVQLFFGYHPDSGPTLTQRATRRMPSRDNNHYKTTSPLGIEFGVVRVTNVGRTAVSVENISFDIGRFHRHRHTICPVKFAAEPDTTETPAVDPSVPNRLEPGATVSVRFHLWPALAVSERSTASGRLRVRGSAHAVGRRRATRSPRRLAWRVPQGATSLFEGFVPPAELRVYRELWQRRKDEMTGGFLPFLMHRNMVERLADGAGVDDIAAWLGELDKEPKKWPGESRTARYGLIALYAYRAYHGSDEPAVPPT